MIPLAYWIGLPLSAFFGAVLGGYAARQILAGVVTPNNVILLAFGVCIALTSLGVLYKLVLLRR